MEHHHLRHSNYNSRTKIERFDTEDRLAVIIWDIADHPSPPEEFFFQITRVRYTVSITYVPIRDIGGVVRTFWPLNNVA